MTDSEPPFDPLDECLKQARWPEPTAWERNRLEAQWESLALNRFHARRRLMRWMLAASVLLALGLGMGGWMLWRPNEPKIIPQDPRVPAPELADSVDEKPEQSPPGETVVRAPTRYEALAFAAASQRHKPRQNAEAKPLVQVLKAILENSKADVPTLSQSLKGRQSFYETVILSRIAFWDRSEQRAALKVLKEIGSPRAIGVLDQLSRNPEFARDAWPVALHLASIRMLGEWANTGTLAQRKDAMQQLLSREHDPSGLALLLHLVARPASRDLALSVLAADPTPPIEPLFAALKTGNKEQRHAAGLALGRLKDPKVTQALLAMAKEQSFPPEVMLGLLNSTDRDAANFVKQAHRHPEARTAVQLAYLEWELISYASQFPHPLEIH